jgi:uncharacterized protein
VSVALDLLPREYAVVRLAPGGGPPAWACDGAFWSVTRTRDEVSVVCLAAQVPAGERCEPGWRLFRFEGPFPFSAIGILASVAGPLARAEISLMALSTFDTDYLLVQADRLEATQAALEAAGHRVRRAEA